MILVYITSKKSIYRDYMDVSQDSIMKVAIEKMQNLEFSKILPKWEKSLNFRIGFGKSILLWKLNTLILFLMATAQCLWVIRKNQNLIGNWPMKNKKLRVRSSKATTEFGGRQWTAWFTEAIPSGWNKKFSGLPGFNCKNRICW